MIVISSSSVGCLRRALLLKVCSSSRCGRAAAAGGPPSRPLDRIGSSRRASIMGQADRSIGQPQARACCLCMVREVSHQTHRVSGVDDACVYIMLMSAVTTAVTRALIPRPPEAVHVRIERVDYPNIDAAQC